MFIKFMICLQSFHSQKAFCKWQWRPFQQTQHWLWCVKNDSYCSVKNAFLLLGAFFCDTGHNYSHSRHHCCTCVFRNCSLICGSFSRKTRKPSARCHTQKARQFAAWITIKSPKLWSDGSAEQDLRVSYLRTQIFHDNVVVSLGVLNSCCLQSKLEGENRCSVLLRHPIPMTPTGTMRHGFQLP